MAHIIACFANDSKGASLHYTSFRDDKRVNVRQGAISREVSARKKFAVKANVEGRVKFNLAHCPANLLGTMLRNQNVYTDTAFAPISSIQGLIQAGLSGRVMFGSDFPIMAYCVGQGLTSTYRAAIKGVKDLEGNDFNGAFHRFLN